MRDKKFKEWIQWIIPKLTILSLVYIICIMWPFLSNSSGKKVWGVDYFFLKPFEYIDVLRDFIVEVSKPLIEEIKKIFMDK